MTSMERELGTRVDFAGFRDRVAREFAGVFHVEFERAPRERMDQPLLAR